MSDFLLVLSFSAASLLAALLFAVITPPLGGTLYLRNEVLFGIALPPAGAFALSLSVALGSPQGDRRWLYAATFVFLLCLTLLLPLDMTRRRLSPRRREILLASVFALSGGLTMLVLALSPRAESHLHYMLHGELLAVSPWEVFTAALFALALAALFLLRRRALYAFCLDEESLFIRRRGYPAVRIGYRLAAVAVVSGGILLIGPMLITALLILPALLAERVTGMDRYMAATSAIGAGGTAAGFILALLWDLPPSPMAALGVLGVGLLLRLPAAMARRT